MKIENIIHGVAFMQLTEEREQRILTLICKELGLMVELEGARQKREKLKAFPETKFKNDPLLAKYFVKDQTAQAAKKRYYIFYWLWKYKKLTHSEISDIFGNVWTRAAITTGINRAVALMSTNDVKFSEAVLEVVTDLKKSGYE